MVVSQSVMIVSEINIRGTSHVGSAIKSLASMIGFVLKSQSSTEQRVKMKVLLRSLLKCSRRTSRIFIRNSIFQRR